jgi:hypothetical protein
MPGSRPGMTARLEGWQPLERFPITWKHVIDKKSLHINKLEHVLSV